MKRAVILTFLLGFATLSGCVFPGVYKLDIQQGNIVSQDTLDQLQPGMSKSQVEFLLGTPVLKNLFHNDRWDYLYTLEEDDEITRQYRILVFFNEAGTFSHYTGEVPPASEEG